MRPTLLISLFVLLTNAVHAAETTATTYTSMASFAVTVSPQFTLEKLPATGEPAATFAAVMPQDARGLNVVGFRGGAEFYFRVAAAATEGKSVQRPYVAVQVESNRPQLLPLDPEAATGPLASIAAWSPGIPFQDGIVLLMTFATSEQDVRIIGFHVLPKGEYYPVNLGGAKSLGGAYEIRDLNDDGTFELLTARNLDGWVGGITYTAVRYFNDGDSSYYTDPEGFKDFFRSELAYFDWVLSTRDKIAENPEAYMSKEPRGWYFAADYQGRLVGFDSLVPLADFEFAGGNVAQWNQRVDSAVRRVTEYRDQLRAWLDSGGPYPAAWQMKR